MLQLFRSATASTLRHGLTALLVLVLLLGALRLVLPFADLFRSDVEGLLAQELGLDVKMSRLGLRLVGWAPRLTLQDAQLVNPHTGRTQLSLEELRVGVDLLASVRTLSPQIDSVTLVGARLVIKRLADGSLIIAGLESMQAGDPAAAIFFLGGGRFSVADSEVQWIDEQSGASALKLTDVQIRFDNVGDRHRIGLLAHLSGDEQTRLHLVADLRGAADEPADWHGAFYLRWRGRDLGRVLGARLPEGLDLVSSAVSIESWADWDGRTLAQSLSRIDVGGLEVRKGAAGETPSLTLNRLSGLLRWRNRDDGWNLEVADLVLALPGGKRQATDLALQVTGAGDGDRSLQAGIGVLDLGDLRVLLPLAPESMAELSTGLEAIRLDGQVRDLKLRYARDGQGPARWAVRGSIHDLRTVPDGALPGLQGLSAEFAVDESRGHLELTSDGLVLTMPRLFHAPLALDRVAGSARWWRDPPDALQLQVSDLVAQNADIETRSQMSLTLPAGEGGPVLDLHTDFHNADAAAVRRYLPVGLLKDDLALWLDGAFVGGCVPEGTVDFHGNPTDFPFAEQQGRFEVLFRLEDAILDYHLDWPRLEGLDADVRFFNQGLEIDIASSRVLGSELVGGSARIANLGDATLVLSATAEGPFSDGLRVLAETPLKETLAPLAAGFRVEGRSKLELELDIPLGPGPDRVRGRLSWPEGASLTISEPGLEFTELAGSLEFTEYGLSAERIEARLWGSPVRIGIATEHGRGGAGSSTRASVSGQTATRTLAKRFPGPEWQLAQGKIRWELELASDNSRMAQGNPPLEFVLTSDLGGVAIDLPAPLGKPASGKLPLRLEGRLEPKKDLGVRGRYGDLALNLGFARNAAGGFRLARGAVSLGGETPTLPRGKGLQVSGDLDELDIPAWLGWWRKREQVGRRGTAGGVAIASATVGVKRLVLPGIAAHDARLDLEREGGSWLAKLKARELDGEIRVPHRARKEPIRIQLERLDLKGLLDREGDEGQPSRDGEQASDPRRAHTLDLQVQQLLWGENPLGSVAVRSRPHPNGIELTDFTLDGPLISVQGNGSWTGEGKEQRTALSITGEGTDLGEFLRTIEYESALEDAPGKATLELAWPGGPGQFSWAASRGRLDVEVGAGSLLEVEPGVGRVLGILNLGVLRRRLSLDFSDLFGRGYAFEQIAGSLTLGDGEARIETLIVEGPSAEISVAGSADLVKRELDQVATVTPRLGTGVAVAGAVAGGPVVGAAVLLADKVSGGVVDKLGRHRYRITGPWDNPDIRSGGKENEAAGAGGDSLGSDKDRSGKDRSGAKQERREAPAVEPTKQKRPAAEEEQSAETAEPQKNLFLEDF